MDIPDSRPSGDRASTLVDIFLGEYAHLRPVPFVPELSIWIAADLTAFWEACQKATANPLLELPFWAVVWPGGAGLARFVLDHPDLFRGRSVLDVASGSGVAALAAARVGARVTANDVDPDALRLCRMAARANGLEVSVDIDNLLMSGCPAGVEIILAGDVFYERGLARGAISMMKAAAAGGVTCLVADAQRRYRPEKGLIPLATYEVPTSVEVEGQAMKTVEVLRVEEG